MSYMNMDSELNEIKDRAKTCIERQKEIVSLLNYAKTEIEMCNNSNHPANVLKKLKLLNNYYFNAGTSHLPADYELDYWLEYDRENTTYSHKYGDRYSKQYLFKFNDKRFAENVLGKPVSKKTIRTNVILKENICTWRDENPYFCVYEDFYLPLELSAYCDKDFDTTKKYTLKEIENLVKSGKIMLDCDVRRAIESPQFSNKVDNKQKVKVIDKLVATNQDFALGKVHYSKDDKIEFGGDKKLLEKLPNLFDVYQYLRDDETNQNCIAKMCEVYPNVLDCIDNEIDKKLAEDVITEEGKIDFMKNKYKAVVEYLIENQKKEIERLQKNKHSFDL